MFIGIIIKKERKTQIFSYISSECDMETCTFNVKHQQKHFKFRAVC